MKGNQEPMLYTTNAAVASLNHVPGFDPLKFLRRTTSRKTGEDVMRLDLRYNASIQSARMQVYFIDNDDYFQRNADGVVDEDMRPDNDERSIFFVRGVMETVKKLRWTPDIIHCHGWITALTPLYIKKSYAEDPSFRDAKVIYSLYDNGFKTPFDPNFAAKLKLEGIQDTDIPFAVGESIDPVVLNKLAIQYSDGVIQASRDINSEITDYVQKTGIPFLGYQDPENYIDAYNDFYNKIVGNE